MCDLFGEFPTSPKITGHLLILIFKLRKLRSRYLNVARNLSVHYLIHRSLDWSRKMVRGFRSTRRNRRCFAENKKMAKKQSVQKLIEYPINLARNYARAVSALFGIKNWVMVRCSSWDRPDDEMRIGAVRIRDDSFGNHYRPGFPSRQLWWGYFIQRETIARHRCQTVVQGMVFKTLVYY